MPRPWSSAVTAIALVALAAPSLAQEKRADTLLTVEKYLDFEQVAEPRVSPDGSQIIYTRRWVNKLEDRFESGLWIMNADGSKNRFLTTGGSAIWSPDGTRIAYLNEGKPSGTQIHVRWMDAEGATSQVTTLSDAPSDLRWSPDGKWIGFSAVVPKSVPWRIDMPEAPKGAKWTSTPRIVQSLHFRQDRRGFLEPGFRHLFVVPADGGTPRQVTKGDWSLGARFDALDQRYRVGLDARRSHHDRRRRRRFHGRHELPQLEPVFDRRQHRRDAASQLGRRALVLAGRLA